MKISAKSGAALAAAAATLMLAGTIANATVHVAGDAKGQCVGGNACKGQGMCKTAKNECKGHNACKGQGWLEMTKADCMKIEGANYLESSPKG